MFGRPRWFELVSTGGPLGDEGRRYENEVDIGGGPYDKDSEREEFSLSKSS